MIFLFTTLINIVAFAFGWMICEWFKVKKGWTKPNWGVQWSAAILGGIVFTLVLTLLK